MRLPFKKTIPLILLFLFFGNIYAEERSRLTKHHIAKPLSNGAKTLTWPRFNGPFDNARTQESPLSTSSGELSIVKIWELAKGEGYASPAISADKLILFHLDEGHEIIEARNPETGSAIWSYKYPAEYRDRYGYSNGPRASPLIWKGKVYAHGVTAWLTCLDLVSGKLIWKRDLKSEFGIPDYFFGKGSNPIITNESVIVNVGGENGECVVSFDLLTGKTNWVCKDEWGASYSSPVMAKLHGKEVCLVFTGGESRPPKGGLLIIDPENGQTLTRFPWRSSTYESANAVPAVPIGNNRIFLSECYEKGGVLIRIDEDFDARIEWHKPELNIHWMTPIFKSDHLYGVSGRHQRGAEIFCINTESGKVKWKNRLSWKYKYMNRDLNLEFFRGSLLDLGSNAIGLSELGSLILLEMNPNGIKILDTKQLFFAPGAWTLPALSNGLLYIMQNETDRSSGKGPRVLCFDLRGE